MFMTCLTEICFLFKLSPYASLFLFNCYEIVCWYLIKLVYTRKELQKDSVNKIFQFPIDFDQQNQTDLSTIRSNKEQ